MLHDTYHWRPQMNTVIATLKAEGFEAQLPEPPTYLWTSRYNHFTILHASELCMVISWVAKDFTPYLIYCTLDHWAIVGMAYQPAPPADTDPSSLNAVRRIIPG